MLPDPSHLFATSGEGTLVAPRILVVEDDFLIRMMLAEILTDDGFDVIEAETGDEALAMLSPDIALVVTDIQLPGSINGLELMARARQTRPNLPAIYTSGRMGGDRPAGALDRSIGKPYQGPEICAAIRQMLAL